MVRDKNNYTTSLCRIQSSGEIDLTIPPYARIAFRHNGAGEIIGIIACFLEGSIVKWGSFTEDAPAISNAVAT